MSGYPSCHEENRRHRIGGPWTICGRWEAMKTWSTQKGLRWLRECNSMSLTTQGTRLASRTTLWWRPPMWPPPNPQWGCNGPGWMVQVGRIYDRLWSEKGLEAHTRCIIRLSQLTPWLGMPPSSQVTACSLKTRRICKYALSMFWSHIFLVL